MRYHSLGQIPQKRHVQFRDPEAPSVNGHAPLLVEEVLGFEGFSGNESILYHLWSPCRVSDVGEFTPIELEEWVPETHVHRLTNTMGLEPMGDSVMGRRGLQYNGDVGIGISTPPRRHPGRAAARPRAVRAAGLPAAGDAGDAPRARRVRGQGARPRRLPGLR